MKKLLPSRHGDGQFTPGVKCDQRGGLPLAERTEEAAADNTVLCCQGQKTGSTAAEAEELLLYCCCKDTRLGLQRPNTHTK